MPGRRKNIYFIYLGIVLISGISYACDLDRGPGTVFLDTPITIEVLSGTEISDTVQTPVAMRFQLVPDDDEAPRPLRLTVAFTVVGEDCGDVSNNPTISDGMDEAATTWTLGTLAQECGLEIRAFNPAGTLLGFKQVDATVEPGQPVFGWLSAGAVERGVDSVTVEQVDLEDRFGNGLPWRFTVVNGPAVNLSEDFADARSRTLVATGEGSGEIDVVSPFGVFLRAAFDVCTANDQRWIRVFRTEDAATVLAACP